MVGSIEQWSESTQYGRYLQNADFYDLTILYKQKFFT